MYLLDYFRNKEMINIPQTRDLIKRTLSKLGEKYASDAAVDLVLGTGIIESRYKYWKQIGDGPAVSFWQIEPDTAVDNCKSFIAFRSGLAERCVHATFIPKRYWTKPSVLNWSQLLEGNVYAAIVHCRIKYWRVPSPMPDTISGQSQYWKKWYNSAEGLGKASEYIDQVSKYI